MGIITDASTAGLGTTRYQERTPLRFLQTRVGLGDLLLCSRDRHEAVSGNMSLLELGAIALAVRVWAPFLRAIGLRADAHSACSRFCCLHGVSISLPKIRLAEK